MGALHVEVPGQDGGVEEAGEQAELQDGGLVQPLEDIAVLVDIQWLWVQHDNLGGKLCRWVNDEDNTAFVHEEVVS